MRRRCGVDDPSQSNSTSYWYWVTDETGTTDSLAVFVEVLATRGCSVLEH